MQGEARIRKLRWMCRRGMKELDVLFEKFLEHHADELRSGQWEELEALLDEEDDRIWAWVQSAQGPTNNDTDYQALIDALRGDT